MVCITHLELCPYCNRIALMVCEYDEPYPRIIDWERFAQIAEDVSL